MIANETTTCIHQRSNEVDERNNKQPLINFLSRKMKTHKLNSIVHSFIYLFIYI